MITVKLYTLIVALVLIAGFILIFDPRSSVEKQRREITGNISRYKRKANIRILKEIVHRPIQYAHNYIKNTKMLKENNWYKSLSGNWTDSHAFQTIPPKEICETEPLCFAERYRLT